MHSSLLPPFQFLASTRNRAAVECLRDLLDSPDGEVRWQAGLAISSRSDSYALERFLEAFDSPRHPCRREWKALGYRLVPTILRVLEDPRQRLYRAALKAIADAEIPEGLAILVRSAEQGSSPHGPFAGKQLIGLASHLGSEVRQSGLSSSIRVSLLELLTHSLNQFSSHRSSAIAEAYLACVDIDDSSFLSFIHQDDESVLKVLARQWKASQRGEVIDLLVCLLNKPFVPRSLCNILFKERKDLALTQAFARGVRHGLSLQAVQRFHQHGVPACCLGIDPRDATLDIRDRWAVWVLLAAGNAPLARILEGVSYFLDEASPDSHLAVASILRHYPSTSCLNFLAAMAPEAMCLAHVDDPAEATDCDDRGESVRQHIRRLLAVLPTCDANLRRAISEFFGDFHVETLLQYVDYLVEDAIECFAEVLRSVHPQWPQMLIPALESPTGERRCRAAFSAYYLGPHPELKASLNRLLDDEYVMVQEEAAYALKSYPVSSKPVLPDSTRAVHSRVEANV